jgi:hypothetical protein
MGGHCIDEPYPCPHHVPPRKCEEAPGGGYTWCDAWCCLWQDVDGEGSPVGIPYEKFHHWEDTGEVCDPENGG